MKILHWAFILIAIILPVSIICRVTVNSRFAALKDEVRINNAIDTATQDAIEQIIVASSVEGIEYDNVFGDVISVTPALAQESINTFFHSMAVNFNIPHKLSDSTPLNGNSSDSYIKNYFAQYVPAVVVIAYDGFYVYSQQETSNGFVYKLSPKIPYAYESSRGYTIGYTLGNDIYFYYNGECYNGRLNYNSRDEMLNKYQTEYSGYDVETLKVITNDISMIFCALDAENNFIFNKFGDDIIPPKGANNFLQDYSRAKDVSVGKFHEKRREVIIKTISDCLREEINVKHNRFADMMGSTYNFYLPEISNDDWINSINDISVMAFVQGIPVGTLDGNYFNNFALGGSQIVKRDYLYGSEYTWKGTSYKLYHHKDCELIKDDNYDTIFLSEDGAWAEGYKPCQKCN